MEHKPDISELLVVLVSFSLYVSLNSLFSVYRFPRVPREGGTKSFSVGVGAWEVIFGSKGKRKRAARCAAAALAEAEANVPELPAESALDQVHSQAGAF